MPETAIKYKPGLKSFKINQVAEILSVHQQTLRNWERHGLIKPERCGRVRIYSNEGKSIFTQSFTQTINFMMTTAKNFCAFHDMNQIYLIDLVTHKVTTFDGSNVFAVNDAGEVAYYDEK